jgi:hypothetical protein
MSEDFKSVSIADLAPTQVTVGMREVDVKRRRWQEKHSYKTADYIGFIWAYNLVWLIVVGFVKVALYRHYDREETRQTSWQTWFHAPLDSFQGRLGKLPKA